MWLGELDALPTEKGEAYATADGVRGTVRSRTDGLRIRVSWQPDDWPHDSTLQLTVKPAASGTTIGIHHEKLADREERRMMLGHWKNVAAAFDAHFAQSATASPRGSRWPCRTDGNTFRRRAFAPAACI